MFLGEGGYGKHYPYHTKEEENSQTKYEFFENVAFGAVLVYNF